MKKMNLFFACTVVMGAVACNSGSDTNSTSTDSSHSSTTSSTATTTPESTATSKMDMPAPSQMTSKTPLNAGDSTFVMKAAMGGMMEVNAGQAAQANAASDRVKNYGAMMVADHGKANAELMALASGKGMTLPAALPADKQKHIDEMAKMKGKSFDSHFVSMMVNDHKKDIADFEKEASGGADADVKAWAAKTLPTLKMHMDSIQAISKMKM